METREPERFLALPAPGGTGPAGQACRGVPLQNE